LGLHRETLYQKEKKEKKKKRKEKEKEKKENSQVSPYNHCVLKCFQCN
jgi:hypothetical protein